MLRFDVWHSVLYVGLLQQHAKPMAAGAAHPPQRTAVALIADGAVLAESNIPAGWTARSFDGDRRQPLPLHLVRLVLMGLFDHAALRPVTPDAIGNMKNNGEFERFFA